ncbi:MAG: ubiquitin-conjugating enzyme E2 [Candidatus Micrarchaeota archaeon]
MPQLPDAVFQRRLQAEYEGLKKEGLRFSADPSMMNFEISLSGKALQKVGSNISVRTDHKFRIEIKRAYPYAGGFDVHWLTPIFHPNIDPKTGKVCIHLLNNWAASQTLASLIKGIAHMLTHPNVKSPLDVEAGEYFYFHPELIENRFENLENARGPKILRQR